MRPLPAPSRAAACRGELPAPPAAMARSSRSLLWALALAAVLLCGSAASGSGLPVPAALGKGGKRSYGFRVQSRDFQPTFRRSLLRNSTMPLHGAVKDYGCASRPPACHAM